MRSANESIFSCWTLQVTETWEQSQFQAACLLLFKAYGLWAALDCDWVLVRSMWEKNKGQCNILALWQTCLNNMKKFVKWVYIHIWHRFPQINVSYTAGNLYPNITALFTSITAAPLLTICTWEQYLHTLHILTDRGQHTYPCGGKMCLIVFNVHL